MWKNRQKIIILKRMQYFDMIKAIFVNRNNVFVFGKLIFTSIEIIQIQHKKKVTVNKLTVFEGDCYNLKGAEALLHSERNKA